MDGANLGAGVFRRIDLSGIGAREVMPAMAEPRPELTWVAIEDLVIDDRYQRPLLDANRHKIRTIAASFTWRHFSACLVSRLPDGLYALIDGQHRAHAAALCGFDAVPCLVVEMPAREQAAAFAAVNGDVSKVTPLQVYRAALAAGEPWAVASRDAVEAAGAKLMAAHYAIGDRKPGQVYAVALIRRLVECQQGPAITRGLRAILEDVRGRRGWWPCWAIDHLRPWLAAVIQVPEARDLGAFHAELDLDRLVEGAQKLQRDPRYAGKSQALILEETLIAMLQRHTREARR